MTDINKLEELAKEMDAEMFKSLRWDELTIKLFGQLPSLISKYRRMEEALKRIENESNQWEPSIYDMGMWACEALKGSGPPQDISALQDEDQ